MWALQDSREGEDCPCLLVLIVVSLFFLVLSIAAWGKRAPMYTASILAILVVCGLDDVD